MNIIATINVTEFVTKKFYGGNKFWEGRRERQGGGGGGDEEGGKSIYTASRG